MDCELASVEDLRALKEIAVVIDVRPPHEVHASGVKVEGYHFVRQVLILLYLGALNVELADNFVECVMSEVGKDKIIICHCARGRRAESARAALIAAGFQQVINGENAQRINEAYFG
jgi:rhodanese-related sulfurtransferase